MGNKSLSKLFTQHEFWLGLLVLLLVVGLSASSVNL